MIRKVNLEAGQDQDQDQNQDQVKARQEHLPFQIMGLFLEQA
jgi:hypothetical protein